MGLLLRRRGASGRADWKRRGDPQYLEGLLDEGGQTPVTATEIQSASSDDEDPESDALYDEAVDYVCRSRRALSLLCKESFALDITGLHD